MRLIPKIKKIPYIYKLKLKMRFINYFLKDLVFISSNNTSMHNIINFTKNHFSNKKHKVPVVDFFKNSKFYYNDWFTFKTNILIKYFEKNHAENKNIKNILEIGSFEGRSSIFFLNYFKNSHIACVDTWKGSHEQNETLMNKVENSFNNNSNQFNDRIKKYKIDSNSFFKNCKENFDFIFIDGYHHYNQVLLDAQNAIKYVNKDGYILFDDFTYRYGGHKKGENAINAINEFLNINKSRLKIIYIYHQVLLKVIKI